MQVRTYKRFLTENRELIFDLVPELSIPRVYNEEDVNDMIQRAKNNFEYVNILNIGSDVEIHISQFNIPLVTKLIWRDPS